MSRRTLSFFFYLLLLSVCPHSAKTPLGLHRATAILHAEADRPLVNIQSDVTPRFHGGTSLVFLNQRPLSSALVHQALLLRPIHSNLSGS
jgi:hypothetical protein